MLPHPASFSNPGASLLWWHCHLWCWPMQPGHLEWFPSLLYLLSVQLPSFWLFLTPLTPEQVQVFGGAWNTLEHPKCSFVQRERQHPVARWCMSPLPLLLLFKGPEKGFYSEPAPDVSSSEQFMSPQKPLPGNLMLEASFPALGRRNLLSSSCCQTFSSQPPCSSSSSSWS